MKKWRIGISQISHPYKIDWQNDYVEAGTKDEAARKAIEKGYYRNLRLREV